MKRYGSVGCDGAVGRRLEEVLLVVVGRQVLAGVRAVQLKDK